MNLFYIVIPVVIVAIIVVVILLKKKKAKTDVGEVFEDIPLNMNQEFNDEPLEPLGNSIIDKEFEGLPSADVVPSQVELSGGDIKPVFNLNIETPITAQEKGTMQIEEKKEEVNTNLDEFKECPQCHTKVEPNATVCFLCGSKLN